jgi:hypothetical protein
MIARTRIANTPDTIRIANTPSIFSSAQFPVFYRSCGYTASKSPSYLSAGISCRIKVITAGPRITTIKAGKIKNTSGGTILTLVLAPLSSAR